MSATTTGWIADAVTELGLRDSKVANNPSQSIALRTRRTLDAGDAPTGASGVPKSKIGKGLAKLVFGDDDARHGRPDITTTEGANTQAEITRTRAMIDEQIKLGTACPANIAGKGGRNLSGNFFSAAGHNLAQTGKPDLTRPVVLFLSGSAGTAEQYGTDVAEHYQGAGASMLAVNYSGYGGSGGGDPCEQSLLDDGQSMLQHLLDLGYKPDQIIMHGFSMGGAVAGVLQAHNEKNGTDLRGLMLDRPMVSIGAATEAHALDAVQEVGGKKAGKTLATLAKPLAKGIAAITRKTCGSMSARKAVTNADSDSRVVISGDEGRFEKNGADLRAKLQGKSPTRSVTGAASGADHLEADPMIANNAIHMQALIDTPPTQGGSGANLQFTAGLSDAQRTSTRKLREKVATAMNDLATEITTLEDQVRNHVALVSNPGNLSLATVAQTTVPLLTALRTRALAAAGTVNQFTTVTASLDPGLKNRLLAQQKKVRPVLQQIGVTLATLGQPVPYDPAQVRTELDYAAVALASYTAMSPTDPLATYKKDQVTACDATLKAMAAAGVTFAGPNLQLSMDVAAATRIIKPPPPPKPPKRVRLDRTNSTPALDRRQAAANLRSSFG